MYNNNLKPIGLNDLPCEILHKIYMINIKEELYDCYQQKKYNNVVKEFNKLNNIRLSAIESLNYYNKLVKEKKYNHNWKQFIPRYPGGKSNVDLINNDKKIFFILFKIFNKLRFEFAGYMMMCRPSGLKFDNIR